MIHYYKSNKGYYYKKTKESGSTRILHEDYDKAMLKKKVKNYQNL